jgi:hypothetical protein
MLVVGVLLAMACLFHFNFIVHRNRSGHAPQTRLSHRKGRLHESTNVSGRIAPRGIHRSINATALFHGDADLTEATEAKVGQPQSRNPKPQISNPKPQTLKPKP